MQRLLNAKYIGILALAGDARTNVDTISRFYASHLTAEVNVELLLCNDAGSIDQRSGLEDLLGARRFSLPSQRLLNQVVHYQDTLHQNTGVKVPLIFGKFIDLNAGPLPRSSQAIFALGTVYTF
jgi:hypothetical protein